MTPPPVFLLGGTGRLGRSLFHDWNPIFKVSAPHREELNIQDTFAIESAIEQSKCNWIINCTGLTSIETCERHPLSAYHLNTEIPKLLASLAHKHRSKLIHFSTDYVFDGKSAHPYKESDPVCPLSIYGRTKNAGELAVLQYPQHFVFRVSWLFGSSKPSFPDHLIQAVLDKKTFHVATDKYSVPTYTHDIAQWLEPVLTGDLQISAGLYHLCNSGSCSWKTYALTTLKLLTNETHKRRKEKLPIQNNFPSFAELQSYLRFCPLAALPNFSVSRPLNSIMDNSKFSAASHQTLRPWQDALRDHLERKGIPAQ